MSENDEVNVSEEKIGGRISRSGRVKSYRYTEKVDKEGTVYKIKEIEKGLNDCGHYNDTGGICQVCESFTICIDCVKSKAFVCDNCHRICCPNCSTESILRPGVRYCSRCGLRGVIRGALKERKK